MKKKKDEITIRSSAAEYLTYVASVGDQQGSIEMRYEDENIWLTQKMMATLYDVGINTINYHIKKIFEDSELQEEPVIRKFRITAPDGKSYNTNHYSLEMIIAVGFKVNSERAVQFRKWVNQIAKDYTIKGWVMDDERLKRGTYLTEKYFDEQLERIREIRASERKFYQKITDLYATAIDYDKNAATTRRFYATVQNKMHYAVHGHTAAELIVERADHTKEHMGLTTWADAPEGKIKKSDVNPAHVNINKVLSELDMDIFKSKNQFFIDAATYYIEHFGREVLTEPKEKKEPQFISTEEMAVIEERIRQEAREEARQEANKEVMSMVGSMLAAMQANKGAISIIQQQADTDDNADSEDDFYDDVIAQSALNLDGKRLTAAVKNICVVKSNTWWYTIRNRRCILWQQKLQM